MQNNTPDELGEILKRSGVAYYHQVYNILSAALNDGLIAAGSALPSETELMGRFGVSRNTVRHALGRLEQEKRIVRRRGSGSYARRNPQSEFSADSIAEVLHDVIGGKLHSSSRLIRVQTVKTPEFIRRKDPEFGDDCMVIQRVRSFKDEPLMFSTSYVPTYLSARLTRRVLARQVVLSALDALGSAPSGAEQITTAVLADTVAARHLAIEPASAQLCIHRLIRDKARRAIEHQSHLFRPDRFQLRASVSIERTSGEFVWSEGKTLKMPAAL